MLHPELEMSPGAYFVARGDCPCASVQYSQLLSPSLKNLLLASGSAQAVITHT